MILQDAFGGYIWKGSKDVESLRRSTWFSDVFSWWRVNGVVGVVGVLVHLVPGS